MSTEKNPCVNGPAKFKFVLLRVNCISFVYSVTE